MANGCTVLSVSFVIDFCSNAAFNLLLVRVFTIPVFATTDLDSDNPPVHFHSVKLIPSELFGGLITYNKLYEEYQIFVFKDRVSVECCIFVVFD